MENLRGELSCLYKKQFQKLDAAEASGKDTTCMRIQLLEAYVRDLNEQNEMLVQMVEEATHCKEENMARERQRTSLISELTEDTEKAQEEVDCLRSSNTQLCEEIACLKEENGRLFKQAEECCKENQCLMETIKEQECELEQARVKICELENCNRCLTKEIECLKQRLCQCQEENQCLKQQVQCLECKLEQAQQEIKCLEKENAELCCRITKLKREIDCLEEKLCTRECCIKQMECEIQRLKDEKSDLCQQIKSTELCVVSLRNQNDELCRNLSACNNKVCRLEEELDCTDCKFEEYRTNHCCSNIEVKQKEEEIDRLQCALKETTCHLEDKCRENQDLKCELDCVKSRLCDLEHKLAACKRESDIFEDKVNQLSQQLNCADEEIRRLERIEDQLCKALSDLEATRRDSLGLSQELSSKEKLLGEHCENARCLEKEVECLQEQLRTEKEQIQKLLEQRACDEREINQQLRNIEKLKTDLSEACNLYNNLAKKAEFMEVDMDKYKSMLSQQERDLHQCELKLETECHEISALRQRENSTSMDLQTACRDLESAHKEITLQREKVNLKDQRLCQVEEEISAMHECIRDYKTELKKSEEYSCRLSMELEKLKCNDLRCQERLEKMMLDLREEEQCRRNLEVQVANKDKIINSLRNPCREPI